MNDRDERSGAGRCAWYRAARPRGLLVGLVMALLAGCSSPGREAVRPSSPVVPPPPLGVPGQPNSADRIVFWVNCDSVAALDDHTLDQWKARGVDGFVCDTQSLFALGGKHHFVADVDHIPGDDEYTLERRLKSSNIAQRAHARGMDLYLSFFLQNKDNTATPLVDWFDDQGWTARVLPPIQDLATAAHALGFTGMGVDQELYPQTGGAKTATWSWSYPGNKHSEQQTRTQVRLRGAQLMAALVTGFPGLELLAYDTQFPDTWAAKVQQSVNGTDNAFVSSVQLDFWDGMSGADGYLLIRLLNQEFYKTPGVKDASWDAALQQEYNLLYSLLSRRFTNWAKAAPRFEESPFSWINPGDDGFLRARPPEAVAEQLEAFSRWGMGGVIGNFVLHGLDGFDYTPYVPGLTTASAPRVVTDKPPTVQVTGPSAQPSFTSPDAKVTLTGTAVDPYAIWYIAWASDRGETGTAQLTWNPGKGDDRNGHPNWQMQWSADVPLQPGTNVISLTTVGIKGLATKTVVTVSH